MNAAAGRIRDEASKHWPELLNARGHIIKSSLLVDIILLIFGAVAVVKGPSGEHIR